METTQELDAAIGIYESSLTALLDVIAREGPSIREQIDTAVDELEFGAVEEMADVYLRASSDLAGILQRGIAGDTRETADEPPGYEPFQQLAIRRLAAASAGDFIAAEALSLIAVTTRQASADLAGTLFEGPQVVDSAMLESIRQGADPLDALLADLRYRSVPEVMLGISGLYRVSGGADGNPQEMLRVEHAIDQIIDDGAETLEKTITAGLISLDAGGIGAHVAEFFGGAFVGAAHERGVGRVVRKVLEIFSAARDKILAVFGNWVPAVRKLTESSLDELKQSAERWILRRILDVDSLEAKCHQLLDALDGARHHDALVVVGRVPEHAKDWERWARYGARGIRIARSLQIFAGGSLWPVLLALSAGLSGYTLWVVQDHLDWPDSDWIPEHSKGIRLSLV